MNNLALLKTYKQDSLDILSNEYHSFMDYLKSINFSIKEKAWGTGKAGRVFFNINELSTYFQHIVNDIEQIVGLSYDNIVIQWGHPTSHVLHRDVYRKTNLTIPLLPVLDPVAFYTDDAKPKSHRYGYADKPAEQITYYSYEHPILLNVCNQHAVLTSVHNKPRALLQIGWDKALFEEIIQHNPNIWEIVTETGKQRLS